MRLWLDAGQTVRGIGDAVGVSRDTVSRVCQEIRSYGIPDNPSAFDPDDFEDEDERQEAITKANRRNAEHQTDFTPPIYNIWRQQHKSNAVSHYGNTEAGGSSHGITASPDGAKKIRSRDSMRGRAYRDTSASTSTPEKDPDSLAPDVDPDVISVFKQSQHPLGLKRGKGSGSRSRHPSP